MYNDYIAGGKMLKWRNGNPVTRYDVIKVIFLMVVIKLSLDLYMYLCETFLLG